MTINANSSGVVTGKFTIPAGVPAGSKRVTFEGAGGSKGEATFIGTGTILNETRRLITTINRTYYDPVAQTFSLSEAAQISSVDLWFSAKGTSRINVQIREVSNGFPTQTIVGESSLPPASISTTTHTRFAFDAPLSLMSSTEYAIVVLCDDAVASVWSAQLGQWDSVNGKWVTSQPYTVGVLLTSSNASTWTPVQDRDLTFRLNKAVFVEVNKNVTLGTVAVTDATDLLVLAVEEAPSASTRIAYTLTLPDSSTVVVASGQPVKLSSKITGNITVAATLYGDANNSPILYPGTQLIVGQVASSAEYVSQAIPCGSNVRVKVVLEAFLPAGTGVAVKYKISDAGGSWTDVTYQGTVNIDDGYVENTYQVTGVTGTFVACKLILTGSSANPANRPIIKNLRFMTA